MTGELLPATRDSTDLIPIEDVKRQMQYFDSVKRELLSAQDFQSIAGKQFIKRSGWRKVALAFNLSDRIVSATRTDRPDSSFVWHVIVEVTASNGRTSTGSGSCDSKERKFAHLEHDVYATAHTRAKNRAISDIVGGGILSAEEMETPAAKEEENYEHEFEEDTREPDETPVSDVEAALVRESLDPAMVRITTTGNRCEVRMVKYDKTDEGKAAWSRYNKTLSGIGFKYQFGKGVWVRE